MESGHKWSHQAGVSIAVSLIPDPELARTGKSKADPKLEEVATGYAPGHELRPWEPGEGYLWPD